MSDLRPVETPTRQQVRSLEYLAADCFSGLVVHVYETGTEAALRTQALDEAHERNASGEHRSGFCRACAENYVAWNEAA